MTKDELMLKIRKEELDINNRELFFKIIIKGLLLNLDNCISIRDIPVPHYILHSGSDLMYLERKGQNQEESPLETTNEDWIYSKIPRCIVNPKGIDLLPDQLSNPYSRGIFQLETDDSIYNISAEFRRMPIKYTVDMTYEVDSFTDAMELTQQIFSKLAFIRNYYITYMGQQIQCSYKIPENLESEHLTELEGTTAEAKTHKISINIEIESTFPVFAPATCVFAEHYINYYKHTVDTSTGVKEIRTNLK